MIDLKRDLIKWHKRNRGFLFESIAICILGIGAIAIYLYIKDFNEIKSTVSFLYSNRIGLFCLLGLWIITGLIGFSAYVKTLGEYEEETERTAAVKVENVKRMKVFLYIYVAYCSFIAIRGDLNLIHIIVSLLLVVLLVLFQYSMDRKVRTDMLKQNAEDNQESKEPPYNLCTDKKYFVGFIWWYWIVLFCFIVGIGTIIKLLI